MCFKPYCKLNLSNDKNTQKRIDEVQQKVFVDIFFSLFLPQKLTKINTTIYHPELFHLRFFLSATLPHKRAQFINNSKEIHLNCILNSCYFHQHLRYPLANFSSPHHTFSMNTDIKILNPTCTAGRCIHCTVSCLHREHMTTKDYPVKGFKKKVLKKGEKKICLLVSS